jgi:hypothetical protein
VLLKCKQEKHISNFRLIYLQVLTLFFPRKYYFHTLTMQKLISQIAHTHFLSEKIIKVIVRKSGKIVSKEMAEI